MVPPRAPSFTASLPKLDAGCARAKPGSALVARFGFLVGELSSSRSQHSPPAAEDTEAASV